MSDSYLSILNAPVIPAEYWRVLSAGAWSNRPHFETTLEFYTQQFTEAIAKSFDESGELDPHKLVSVGGPDLPADLDGIDKVLPPLSPLECKALLVQFLRAERGELVAGARINILHWLLICGAYAPARERYTSLRELVDIQRLASADGAVLYLPSGIKWPLIMTAAAMSDLEELANVRRHIPTIWKGIAAITRWVRAIPLIGEISRKQLGG